MARSHQWVSGKSSRAVVARVRTSASRWFLIGSAEIVTRTPEANTAECPPANELFYSTIHCAISYSELF